MRPESSWRPFFDGLFVARRRGAYDAAVGDRLRRVRLFLERHPEEPLDLEAMARVACFSKFHFLRLFRAAYGETPKRYLAQLRMERARELLETSARSVTDICLDVGYESLPSFSAAFRRHAGVPPERYRRRWIAVPGTPRRSRVPSCFVAMYGGARLLLVGHEREVRNPQ